MIGDRKVINHRRVRDGPDPSKQKISRLSDNDTFLLSGDPTARRVATKRQDIDDGKVPRSLNFDRNGPCRPACHNLFAQCLKGITDTEGIRVGCR
ncbi:hypothetical protein [Gordonia zhaorongruii]|uniref:hypothetical protein n=1 Tax=Gordonia zhaorongruii TaxID=2597659 RepID=UPI001043C453|nr:hypothetical protein [Gordonia zhaorongruii]